MLTFLLFEVMRTLAVILHVFRAVQESCLKLLRAVSSQDPEVAQFCQKTEYKPHLLRGRCLNCAWGFFDEIWMPRTADDRSMQQLSLEDIVAIISADQLYTKAEEHVRASCCTAPTYLIDPSAGV